MALTAGGLPLLADGQLAGAIRAAAAMTGADDRQIAKAAVAAPGFQPQMPRRGTQEQ